jgi:hypothetical protein
MILQWMLRVSIASGLIAVGSLLIERALVYRGGARRPAWVAGVLASIALPVLAWLAPGLVSGATLFRLDLSGI